ncbi:MAG TPA: hypothetical protein EYH58_06200 [Aquifex aeolicus]|nr:hypothetical protein [Aquifex aeolicus]
MSLGIILSFLFVVSCASMKEVEEISKNSVKYLHDYYGDREKVNIEISYQNESVPSFSPPKFIKVKVGSYVDEEGNIHERNDAWIKVEDEDFGTDFSLFAN